MVARRGLASTLSDPTPKGIDAWGATGLIGSAMIVEQTVTYLRMPNPRQLRPSRPVEGLELGQVDDPSGIGTPVLRALHDQIAAPHHWSSLSWSDGRWKEWLTTPGLQHWYVEFRGRRIGWACLQRHSATEVEIDNFGLIPSVVGQGFGGPALTRLTRIAWDLIVEEGIPAEESAAAPCVWLHTSSFDHPHALPNYQARGFEVYAHETRQRRVEPAVSPSKPASPNSS